jgi:hypothetical protein
MRGDRAGVALRILETLAPNRQHLSPVVSSVVWRHRLPEGARPFGAFMQLAAAAGSARSLELPVLNNPGKATFRTVAFPVSIIQHFRPVTGFV